MATVCATCAAAGISPSYGSCAPLHFSDGVSDTTRELQRAARLTRRASEADGRAADALSYAAKCSAMHDAGGYGAPDAAEVARTARAASACAAVHRADAARLREAAKDAARKVGV
jgi:hypothetical protein